MSYFFSKPVSSWTQDDVSAWLASLNLQPLAPSFHSQAVTGPDLYSLTYEDLTGSLGCTTFQAKKLIAEVGKLGGAVTGQPAPAAYAAYPPPPGAYHTPQVQSMGSQEQPMTPHPSQAMPSYPSQPGMGASPPSSAEVQLEQMRQEMDREKMKNDLRREMDVQARLAAASVVHPAPAPIVVSNNIAAGVGGGGAAYYGTERYCGPISLLIGIFLLPCICFCPVDQRPVAVMPVAGVYRY